METFIRIIDHISGKEYQKRAWIGGEKADFDETVCIFFGDGDSIVENYKDFGITETQYKPLKIFYEKFRIFADNNDFPEEFIDNPEWAKIMDLAKEVSIAFNFKSR